MRESPSQSIVRIAAAVGAVLGGALSLPAAAAGETPQLIRFHGGGYDRAGAITADSSGNSYLGGAVETTDGSSPFAVVKLGPDGTVRWTARYNGSRGGVGGQPKAVAVDAGGNVYAAGYVHDGVIFNQNYDYLVVKFGPDGAQRWAQRYNGPGNYDDFATQLAVDAAGNVHVTGFSYGADFDYDWATLKFAADGTLRWERRLDAPGRSDDRAADMALLPDGNIIVSGVTQPGGEQFPDNDAETVAYDPQGTIVWQARWSDTAASHEFVFDLDVDASGRIAITGTTQENTSPYVPPFPLTLRYDAGGALLQTIRSDGGSSVDLDAGGNVYVTGSFVAPGGTSSVAKFDPSGQRVWATPLGVDLLSRPLVAADSSGAVTVAGTVTDGSTGNGDYLTIRYAPDGRELWRHRFGGQADPGQQDQVAGLVVDASDAALVTGTSWNGYLSIGGTADDIVTLKFAAGSAPALTAPSQLDATPLSSTQIRLRWQDNAGTEDGFRIERCTGTGCSAFAQVAVVGHDLTSYVDGGLARNTAYSYRVRAFNAGGVSAYSNTATAKTRRK
jgi:Fibronectin type III domain